MCSHSVQANELCNSSSWGSSALHLRCQSLPVQKDMNNRRSHNNAFKLDAWVLGNEGPSEDWNGDFESEELLRAGSQAAFETLRPEAKSTDTRMQELIELFIADELHMLGESGGFVYEIIVSRMYYVALQTENNMRLVDLTVSLSNARDVGEWPGVIKHTIYNFSPHVRPVRMFCVLSQALPRIQLPKTQSLKTQTNDSSSSEACSSGIGRRCHH